MSTYEQLYYDANRELNAKDKQLVESQKRETELQNHKRAVLRILEVINGDPATSVIEQVIALQEENARLRKMINEMPCYLIHEPSQVHLCRACQAKQALAAKENGAR